MEQEKKDLKKANEMAKIVYHALNDKQAEDIKIIDISDVSVMADYFIIANGSNPNQIKALVDNVEEHLSGKGYEPKQIEGTKNTNWVLMDYGDVIVHIFSKEDRLFYDLERIWRDGREISFEVL